MSQISFQNSITTRTITGPFTFTGEYVDITAYAEVNVLLQGSLAADGDNYTVSADLSNDRVNILEIVSRIVAFPTSNDLIKIIPSGNFIRIRVQLLSGSVSNFNLSTVLRSSVPLSGITTIKGDVAIIQSVPLTIGTLPDITIQNTSFEAIGEEPQSRFYATPATNLPTVYADGAKGVTVNGGWLFENTSSNTRAN